MTITEAIIQAVSEIISMFGMNARFQREIEECHLTSANQVNVLIGFSNSFTGNMVLEMDNQAALHLISAMMGGMEVNSHEGARTLDDMGKSGVGEVLNMIAGSTFRMAQPNEITDLAPPTIVTGNNVFLMISRVKSSKVVFQFEKGDFAISYSREK